MATNAAIENEVELNYVAFQALAVDLMGQNLTGHFALLRHQKIVQVFSSAGEAFRYGKAQFQDRLFSIQEVTDKPFDQGYFSHGGPYQEL